VAEDTTSGQLSHEKLRTMPLTAAYLGSATSG
jgi:hypothetical protein